jgi:hypothetical protein
LDETGSATLAGKNPAKTVTNFQHPKAQCWAATLRLLAVWGIFWLGGKFSHAKTSIEHKRRYAHL